jgi:di/tricarboxylate transporter
LYVTTRLSDGKTGAAVLVVQPFFSSFGGSVPIALGAALFIFTSVLNPFISDKAITVLMASTASPVNILILIPKKYSFKDFIKVGVPLQLLAKMTTLLFIPLFFSFIKL